jgi:hypothetical protein
MSDAPKAALDAVHQASVSSHPEFKIIVKG